MMDSPAIPAAPTADHDGYTDIEEYLRGTNPRLFETSNPTLPEHRPDG